MDFPLSFFDLRAWLGITALILLATFELVSSYYGRSSLIVEKKRLKMVALMFSFLFMIMVVVEIVWIMVTGGT